ncbi:putative bifunctional diguanylate cyclase/phosphodiesterase [Vibrio sp. WJH972]
MMKKLFGNWRIIVDSISDYLDVSTIEIVLCQDERTEIICRSKNLNQVGDTNYIDVENIKNALFHSLTPTSCNEFMEGQIIQKSESIWYCGIALCDPQLKPFGLLLIADNKPHQLQDSHYLLLNSYKLIIEAQLKMEIQEIEINQLKISCGQELSTALDTPCNLVTDALNQEIIKRKSVEEELNYHRYYDTGTGFLNRFALEVELKNHFSNTKNVQPFALIHIGFSNAKSLQTRFGYKEWETVLTQYHDRLKILENTTGIKIARPNSIDLALLVRSHNLHHQVESICSQLLAINKSVFNIHNQVTHLHSYIGISTSHNSSSVDEILDQASSAMLSCRDSGLSHCYHSQALSDSQSHHHQLEDYLLQAVRNEDLMLYFQPKVCAKSKRWTGAEALLRWSHPTLGDISTETLIHMAEKNGLIFEVGSFVLRTAIEKASQWVGHINDFKMAVNISAKQLKDVRFVEQVKQLLKDYKLPPHFLEIEVTESSLITDEHIASDTLKVLHKLGVTISLDDFGTGYASFNYLKKFPFDCIKIDKSFIHPLEHSEDDREIVRSIIQIAKILKLKVIIEGVETKEQEAFLMGEGCDYNQGFLYGHPMPADDFENGLINQYPSFSQTWTRH